MAWAHGVAGYQQHAQVTRVPKQHVRLQLRLQQFEARLRSSCWAWAMCRYGCSALARL